MSALPNQYPLIPSNLKAALRQSPFESASNRKCRDAFALQEDRKNNSGSAGSARMGIEGDLTTRKRLKK